MYAAALDPRAPMALLEVSDRFSEAKAK